MPSAPTPASRLHHHAFGLRQPVWQDFGLMMLSVAGVATAYAATADSVVFATAVVIAISTAAGMHPRLAMGRVRAAVRLGFLRSVETPGHIVSMPVDGAAAGFSGLAAGEMVERQFPTPSGGG